MDGLLSGDTLALDDVIVLVATQRTGVLTAP